MVSPGFRKHVEGLQMSCDEAIKIRHLSKCFQIYEKPRDRLLQMIVRGRKQYYREFWAIKDVTFEVLKGETVGIVGRNGSGKSTLLQLICGTLNPTSGIIQTRGRIAALLELGSGFNPDFTGRENVYMNGAVLGHTKKKIDAIFDEINAFADIGDFINQPVKSYSSGMVMRLAFSVAVSIEPQVLVVDEALSVGDELFQRKCFSRMETLKNNGSTILFVSHSGTAVIELCDRALLLDEGELISSGSPKTIVGRYQRLLYSPDNEVEKVREGIIGSHSTSVVEGDLLKIDNTCTKDIFAENNTVSEDYFDPNLKPESTISYQPNGATIESPKILNENNEAVNCINRKCCYKYTYRVIFSKNAKNIQCGMLIKSLSGVELGGGVSSLRAEKAIPKVSPDTEMWVEFHFKCALNPGVYFLNAGVVGEVDSEETYLHRLLDACIIRVLPCTNNRATGLIDFRCDCNIIKK